MFHSFCLWRIFYTSSGQTKSPTEISSKCAKGIVLQWKPRIDTFIGSGTSLG